LARYLYWENADLDEDSVMNVLYAAKKYAVQGLETACREYLKSQKSVDNVCTILEQAHLFDDEELQASCLQFIFRNPTAVLKSPGLQGLSSGSFGKVLEADDLSASEEEIFGAALTWSDSECRRRNLVVTGENRRTVLGPVLGLIRFPVIDKKYFINTISKLNILSPEEKIEVFQYHCGDSEDICTHFSTKHRSNARLLTCCMLSKSKNLMYRGGVDNGKPHAISFTSSQDITLCGVQIGGKEDGLTYNVSLAVYDSKGDQVVNTKRSIKTNYKPSRYQVLLSESEQVPVNAGQVYTIELVMSDPSRHGTIFSTDGMATVKVRDVTFRFFESAKSRTNTSVKEGQIPGLLFR
jgi:BTB/POZ domain-containing protein 1/2